MSADAAGQVIQVVTTTANREDARRIAAALIERRLAACVQITGPIESHYHWQGKVNCDEEWRCTIKSTAALFTQIEQAIGELHPYQLPQIVAFAAVAASAGYASWVLQEVSRNE